MAADATARSGHLNGLDGLRGLAILAVYVFHGLWPSFGTDAPAWGGWHRAAPLPWRDLILLPAELGWAGVAVFFVVSGFCIHLTHQRSGERGFGGFFLRRFFRIYPPYLVAVLFFALVFAGTRLDLHVRHNLDQLVSHLLLIHNYLGPGFLYGINPALWSIGVEVQLYLLYPALLWLVGKIGWTGALRLIAGIEITLRLAFGCYAPGDPARLWLLGDPFLYWFSWALGAWLCERWRRGEDLPLATTPISLWAGLAVVSYFFSFTYGFGFLLWALATTALLARLLNGDLAAPFLTGVTLRRIGIISYSIYLLHQPLLNLVGTSVFRGWTAFGLCLVALPALLFLSWLFYCLVERPSIAVGKWIERRITRSTVPLHLTHRMPAPVSTTP